MSWVSGWGLSEGASGPGGCGVLSRYGTDAAVGGGKRTKIDWELRQRTVGDLGRRTRSDLAAQVPSGAM